MTAIIIACTCANAWRQDCGRTRIISWRREQHGSCALPRIADRLPPDCISRSGPKAPGRLVTDGRGRDRGLSLISALPNAAPWARYILSSQFPHEDRLPKLFPKNGPRNKKAADLAPAPVQLCSPSWTSLEPTATSIRSGRFRLCWRSCLSTREISRWSAQAGETGDPSPSSAQRSLPMIGRGR
jgi:hypothetical protein